MPLTTQQGSVADRLRNFFRVAGRIPAQLDEIVVPVANLQYLGEPPWRTGDADFYAWGEAPAVAVRSGVVILRMPAGASGVAVVERLDIANGTVSNIGFEVAIASNVENDAAFANFVTVDQAVDVEHLALTAASAFVRLPPICSTADTIDLTVGYQIERRRVLSATDNKGQVRVSLRGRFPNGVAQSQALIVTARSQNLAFDVGFKGTFFPQAV